MSPYIPQHLRANLVDCPVASNPGELNFLITDLILVYLTDKYRYNPADKKEEDEVNYEALNEIVGVLECAKHEFMRRLLDRYEDEKRTINGDVYR